MGRVLGACVTAATVGGCAVLVIGMGRAGADRHPATASRSPEASAPAIPAQLPAAGAGHSLVAGSSAPAATATSASSAPGGATPSGTPSAAGPGTVSATASATAPAVSGPGTGSASARTRTTTRPPPAAATAAAAVQRGQALPLRYSTGRATRVITVVASSYSSTTATLQAWRKAPGGGWLRVGPAVTAHVGADGLSTSPSESRSATPIGSFTLTQAFGADADPGTGLPYLRTNPADWWISQPGPLYNTHQRCWSNCPFNRGSPNEHLYYETPYYDYAVVIDYNTRNAPGGVHQGAGSAFFLHVTDGTPTAGCVAIPVSRLLPIMRWLTPSARPRILIGVN